VGRRLDAKGMPRNPRLGLAVVAAAVVAAAVGGSPTAAAGPCDQVGSPGRGAAQRLVDSLDPGQTGCLHGGLYEGNVRVGKPGIMLTSYAGEKATVKGRFYIPEGSDNVTVEGLYLDGTNPDRLPSPTVNSDGVTFRRNDITNYHRSICLTLGHPDWGRARNTTVEFNRIHDCGRLPATNHDHGIYVATATNTLIRGNWIYDNADFGVHLYPDAQKTTVTGNVIDGNGEGITFSGEYGVATNDSLVEGNVITNSRVRNNVESWFAPGNPIGRNNVVRGNCVRGGAYDHGDGGIAGQWGFRVVETVRTRPAFASRSRGDFRVEAGNPCREVLGAYRAIVPGPDGAIRGFVRAKRRAPAVILGAFRQRIQRGQRLPMMGRVASRRAGLRVVVVARVRGHQRRLATVRVRRNGTFALRPRVRVARGVRVVRVHAVVRGVGRSRVIRIRLHSR
jgi:parallel beta-helix repeat protein